MLVLWAFLNSMSDVDGVETIIVVGFVDVIVVNAGRC